MTTPNPTVDYTPRHPLYVPNSRFGFAPVLVEVHALISCETEAEVVKRQWLVMSVRTASIADVHGGFASSLIFRRTLLSLPLASSIERGRRPIGLVFDEHDDGAVGISGRAFEVRSVCSMKCSKET